MRHSKTFEHGAVGGSVCLTGRVKRQVTVLQAIQWALGVEHASIDFDDDGSGAGRVGVSPIWVMMQRGQLGCQIDGGGRSRSHHDADIIAAILEALPRELGGRGMAVQVAGLARAGLSPDWMKAARPRCVPVAWRNTKHGAFAKTTVVGVEVFTYRGREMRVSRDACPVRYVETVEQISAARARYLDWWGALLWLRHELAGAGLMSLEVTSAMPPMTPWRVGENRLDEICVDVEDVIG
jgi:hypothetical protein